MQPQSLLRKLIPPLAGAVAALTLVILLAGVIVIRSAVFERAQVRALALAVAQRDNLERLMRAGDHSNLQAAVEQLARNPDVAAVRLLHPDGTVRASSFSSEVGLASGAHSVQASPHGDVLPVALAGANELRGVHTLQPFLNKPACRQCHPAEVPILGYQDLDVLINQHATGLLTFTTLSGLLGLLYLGAVVGVTAPLVALVVRKPVSRLIAAMDRVKAGDLSTKIEPTHTREIDMLVDGFNSMVDQLKQGRQAEQMARRLELERVEQLASVGELAAGLAHEIRNPLSGVKAVLEIMARDATDKERQEVLRDAANELMRIDHIVRDLLQYARPKRPVVSPFDLNTVVRDTLRLTLGAGTAEDTHARSVLDPALPPVLGDAAQVRQVLVNVLLNARQASASIDEVAVATGSLDGRVWCRVRGGGPGVPADRADAIFRPFVTSKARGTGLGLAISRRIAELHGGTLELDNPGEPNASFTLTLPAAPAPPQA